MVDYLNLTPGEQQVKRDMESRHEDQCSDCEAAGWADERRWEHIPAIVCLCGSTRFYKEFMRANYEETLAGKIVLSVGFYMHSAEAAHGESWGCTPQQQKALDELYMRKIDLADEVLILNVGGYIGESTGNELAYARERGKTIRFLEPEHSPCQ